MILLLALNTPAYAAAVSGSPWHSGPILARFFFAGPRIDGIPVYAEQWRCWTGERWSPMNGATCRIMIFHGRLPEPIPAKQRRLE